MEYFDEQVCNLEYVVKVPALQVELVSLSVYVSRIKHILKRLPLSCWKKYLYPVLKGIYQSLRTS